MFHGLMRWAIFPQSDAVVRKDVDRFQTAQRPETNRRFHVIGKREEGGAKRQHTAVRGHSIHCGAHGVFSNTEGDVAPSVAPYTAHCAQSSWAILFGVLEIAPVLQCRV